MYPIAGLRRRRECAHYVSYQTVAQSTLAHNMPSGSASLFGCVSSVPPNRATAGWLLMSYDRPQFRQLLRTQEFLSYMLRPQPNQ
jgi:hypothetical protein